MSYTIKRECWSEKTYNGYVDSPYWYITFSFYKIGLKDNGEFWGIDNCVYDFNTSYIKETLNRIITECKLNINLNQI
jgi:hypothetical protein